MAEVIRTAFDLYLQEHPEAEGNVTSNQPVVFFTPDSDQPGMRDFRPRQLPLVEVVSETAVPKDLSVTGTAPTPPELSPAGEGVPATAKKVTQTPPGQQVKKGSGS